jgi:hypothetical protein
MIASKFRAVFLSVVFILGGAIQAVAGTFDGTWTGTGTNSFGVSYSETIVINVSGSSINGTYESSQSGGPVKISGKVTGSNTITITVFGQGTAELFMTFNGNNMSYTWEWGTGKLSR